MRLFLCFLLIGVWCLLSCEDVFVPKPKGYFHINLPTHQYQVFKNSNYPYSFEYPIYCNIVRDSTFFNEPTENPWWINIDFPTLNARIYVSYKEIDATHHVDKLINDAYTMTNKNSVKAYSIEDSTFVNQYGIASTFFTVGGDVATKYQFFLTDSIHRFFRGSLYFNTTPNEDSLRVVTNFLLVDLHHLMNTFQWQSLTHQDRLPISLK